MSRFSDDDNKPLCPIKGGYFLTTRVTKETTKQGMFMIMCELSWHIIDGILKITE